MNLSSQRTDSAGTSTNRRKTSARVANADNGEFADASTSGVIRESNVVRWPSPSCNHEIDTDAFAGPWSVLTSKPFTSVAVHAHAGHLLIDLQSTEGNVRMQLMRRDLPVVLKTMISVVGQLAAVSE